MSCIFQNISVNNGLSVRDFSNFCSMIVFLLRRTLNEVVEFLIEQKGKKFDLSNVKGFNFSSLNDLLDHYQANPIVQKHTNQQVNLCEVSMTASIQIFFHACNGSVKAHAAWLNSNHRHTYGCRFAHNAVFEIPTVKILRSLLQKAKTNAEIFYMQRVQILFIHQKFLRVN